MMLPIDSYIAWAFRCDDCRATKRLQNEHVLTGLSREGSILS